MADDTSPVFTLEAANASLPRVRAVMEVQMGRRAEIEERLERLAKLAGGAPQTIQVLETDAPAVRDLKLDLVVRVQQYQEAWQELESTGAVLKDARRGLVDFYGRVDGKAVWLCWCYGEDAVSHYHALDEGFSGRRPIEPTMRQRHLN